MEGRKWMMQLYWTLTYKKQRKKKAKVEQTYRLQVPNRRQWKSIRHLDVRNMMKVRSIWYLKTWEPPRWIIKLYWALTYKKQKMKKAKVEQTYSIGGRRCLCTHVEGRMTLELFEYCWLWIPQKEKERQSKNL